MQSTLIMNPLSIPDSPLPTIHIELPHYLHLQQIYTIQDSLLYKSPELFFSRHRDSPALFQQGNNYLFSSEQQQELSLLFPSNWQKNLTSPLHSLIGSCRISSSHRIQAYDYYSLRNSSVSSFIQKMKDGRQLIVSDINISKISQHLTNGPNLFQYSNLLNQIPTNPQIKSQDHTLCFAIMGTRGSYTAPHIDFYGSDSYLYLVSGEKLWIYAPPEKLNEFNTMFKQDSKAATIRFTKEQKQYMSLHHIHFIHQKSGDIVYIPGGWSHMVKNLTDTVAFGNSYLRPWKMNYFFSFLNDYGLEESSILVNVREICQELMKEERQYEWGIRKSDFEELMKNCGHIIKRQLKIKTGQKTTKRGIRGYFIGNYI